jgi:hypothetical protein
MFRTVLSILKQSFNGMKTFFTPQRVVGILVFLLLVWLINQNFSSKMAVAEKMEDGTKDTEKKPESVEAASDGSGSTASGSGYATHEVANPTDLLPTDENSQWSALNPNAAKPGDTAMPDLLKAGHHIGLDTIGQTLRNANLQLRSDPIVPKAEVGPWNQSTIETDFARVPLELGPTK